MGCDIHLHQEVLIDGVWMHWGNPHVRRDYEIFSKMADVRNRGDIKPISLPKGLPSNASLITQLDRSRMGVDGHSDSWLSAQEIHALYDWCEDVLPHSYDFNVIYFGYLMGNGWEDFYMHPDSFEGIDDVRWVFWFDN